jgi:hypothetical protein
LYLNRNNANKDKCKIAQKESNMFETETKHGSIKKNSRRKQFFKDLNSESLSGLSSDSISR